MNNRIDALEFEPPGAPRSAATGNPYLQEFLAMMKLTHEEAHLDLIERHRVIGGARYRASISGWTWELSQDLKRTYAWAVPCDHTLDVIAAYGPIIEMGAGTGYWAALLQERGVDIVAYDPYPVVPGHKNQYFESHARSFFPVKRGWYSPAARHDDRALLMIWAPNNNPFARRVLERYTGDTLLWLAEEELSGDREFYAMLDRDWERFGGHSVIQYDGIHDSLDIYKRRVPHVKRCPHCGSDQTHRSPSDNRWHCVRCLAVFADNGAIKGNDDPTSYYW